MDIPFGLVENGKLYRVAMGNLPALELEPIDQEISPDRIVGFQQAFDKLEAKLNSLEDKIENSSNKASFLSGLINLKESLPQHKGLGDYESLLERIAKQESFLEDYVLKNRQKNTDIKRALLLELDVILANVDIEEAFEQIRNLKHRWLKTGSAEKEQADEIEQHYEKGLTEFFEKRKSHLEAKNLLKSARTEDYESIIDEISGFLKRKEFGKTFDRVKELQKKWKETGRIPESDFKKLNEQYWKVCQKYFEESKKNQTERKKQKHLGEKDSLEKRKSILDQLSELSGNFDSANQKKFNELRKSWKQAGSLPKKKFEEFQNRFTRLADIIREQYFVLQMTQNKNKDFDEKSDDKKMALLIQTIRNLLRRDQEELKSFEENMDKMHINKGSFVDMLESKLANQKDKVTLKKEMLHKYRSHLEALKP